MGEEQYQEKIIDVVFIFAAVIGVFWYWFLPIPSDGAGADAVRDELRETGSHQQAAAESVERAEVYAQSSEIRLGRAAECTEELQAGTESSAELIAECQSIIRKIRQRGKVKATSD